MGCLTTNPTTIYGESEVELQIPPMNGPRNAGSHAMGARAVAGPSRISHLRRRRRTVSAPQGGSRIDSPRQDAAAGRPAAEVADSVPPAGFGIPCFVAVLAEPPTAAHGAPVPLLRPEPSPARAGRDPWARASRRATRAHRAIHVGTATMSALDIPVPPSRCPDTTGTTAAQHTGSEVSGQQICPTLPAGGPYPGGHTSRDSNIAGCSWRTAG